MSGRFIVIEGADGVGTTTQTAAVARALSAQGRTVHTTCQPSGGIVGKLVRGVLNRAADHPTDRHALALLFAADRLDHVAREIVPQLAAGNDVVCDRYVLSSLVYQTLDAPVHWVQSINAQALSPHITVLMTLPLDVALRRLARRTQREIFEDDASQRRVHEKYQAYAQLVDAHVVDGSAEIPEVTARIMNAIATARGR